MRDLVKQRFGNLIVLGRIEKTLWFCRCDCGKFTQILGTNLRKDKPHTQSCGCLQKKRASEVNTRHGMTKSGVDQRFYNIWASMKQRCADVSYEAYPRYGARGIQVCERWSVFQNFYEDMFEGYGETLSLDRIDNDGNYEPANCRWATIKEQARNRRSNKIVKINGETLNLIEVVEKYDSLSLGYKLIHERINRGWDINRAFIEPKRLKS